MTGKADPGQSQITEITRSFSRKVNLGNYESFDVFCSQKSECAYEDRDVISAELHAFCKAQVMQAIAEYSGAPPKPPPPRRETPPPPRREPPQPATSDPPSIENEPQASAPPPPRREIPPSTVIPPPDLPTHWRTLFAALDTLQPDSDQACFEQIEREVLGALPGTGQAFIDRTYKIHGVDRGGLGPDQIKTVILEMLAAIKKSPSPEVPEQMDFKLLQAFGKEKERLGEPTYYKCLKALGGVEHANEFTRMEKMKSVLDAMKTMQPPAPPTEPDPNAYKATDTDVPEIIGAPVSYIQDILRLKARFQDAGAIVKFSAILSNTAFVQQVEDVKEEHAFALIANLEDALRDLTPASATTAPTRRPRR